MADENEAVATVDPLTDAATEENEAAATADPLADAATDEDNLYEDGYVKGTADYIKECATPMTIAVQGNWGVGKTSLFNLITKEFQVKAESKEDDNRTTRSTAKVSLALRLSISASAPPRIPTKTCSTPYSSRCCRRLQGMI